jgi:integrase/recombinase XerD
MSVKDYMLSRRRTRDERVEWSGRKVQGCQFHPELCPKNPTEGVKFERVPMPPAQSLTPEEMKRVWTAIAQRTETKLRDLAMVQLLSHNLRAGEVASANVGSFDGRLVTLTETKNKKPRIVPLSEAGQQAIQTYLKWRRGQGEALTSDSPLILSHHPGWEGDRLSYHGIYFAVERIGVTLPRKSGHSRRVDNRGECSNDTKTTQDLYRRAEG